MACTNVEGTWEEGVLIVDDTQTVLRDPVLDLGPPDGGVFEGAFRGEANFRGRCSNDGPQPTITFKRLHLDGVTITIYRGKVVVIDPETGASIIRGRFTRITVGAERFTDADDVTVLMGDWETEKPT